MILCFSKLLNNEKKSSIQNHLYTINRLNSFFISFTKLINSTPNSYENHAMLYDDLFDKTRPRPRIHSYIPFWTLMYFKHKFINRL